MKLMISAGEASGDMHAASLIDEVRKQVTTVVDVFGMGGTHLKAAGTQILVDADKHAVMGLLEVLYKYPSLRSNLNTLREALKQRKPDVLVVVDYPHFNMKLAETAKSLDIPVLFFIAPKVWASRAKRVEELKKLVDHMALILPFETKIFQDADIPCTYVGNPLLDNSALIDASRKPATRDQNTIALLPGSRKSEISLLLQPMLDTAAKLTATAADIKFILPVADTVDKSAIESAVADSTATVELIDPADYQQLRQCRAALVASGTATLELALLGVPMVVIYKLNSISYKVVKRWLTVEHISLVNIISGKRVVPELLQEQVTADNLAAHLSELLSDGATYTNQLSSLEDVSEQLGAQGASKRAAELAVQLASKGHAPVAV